MKITTFQQIVADLEGKKDEQNIAQISETLRCANDATEGVLYGIIRLMQEPRAKRGAK